MPEKAPENVKLTAAQETTLKELRSGKPIPQSLLYRRGQSASALCRVGFAEVQPIEVAGPDRQYMITERGRQYLALMDQRAAPDVITNAQTNETSWRP